MAGETLSSEALAHPPNANQTQLWGPQEVCRDCAGSTEKQPSGHQHQGITVKPRGGARADPMGSREKASRSLRLLLPGPGSPPMTSAFLGDLGGPPCPRLDSAHRVGPRLQLPPICVPRECFSQEKLP